MRKVMLGVLCALALSSVRFALAADSGGAGEAGMDSGGMPQAPAGSGAHPLCWIDIQAKDVAAARKFYGDVFGWTFFEEEGSADYLMFSPPAGLMGALTAKPEDLAAAQGCMVQLYTTDIDADIAYLEEQGLQIVQPKETLGDAPPHQVSTAVFADAAGTRYGLITMAPQWPVPDVPSGLGSGPKPPAGSLCSIELYGGDFAKVRQLFGEHFGWGLLDTMPSYLMFNAGAGIRGVFQSHTAATKSMAYIYVDDVKAKLTEIEAAGGKRIGEPMSMPGMGTFGYFSDPNGIGMGLIGP